MIMLWTYVVSGIIFCVLGAFWYRAAIFHSPMLLIVCGSLCSAFGALGSLAVSRMRPLTSNERADLHIHLICAVMFVLIAFLEKNGL